jgi:hypothetical protein
VKSPDTVRRILVKPDKYTRRVETGVARRFYERAKHQNTPESYWWNERFGNAHEIRIVK